MIDPSQLNLDRHTLDLLIDAARSGHAVTILPSELEAFERIHAFLDGPNAREIDAIVDKHQLNQNDAERTVRAIFGESK